MLSYDQCFKAIDSTSALAEHGMAKALRSKLRTAMPGLGNVVRGSNFGSLKHLKPETIICLVWPCYLQMLAASSVPVTQACPPPVSAQLVQGLV